MKAMILSDLIIMRKYLAQQSVIGLALGILLAFVMENPYVVSPLISVTVSGNCAFTVLALDERNGWERYRLALPISRANVVSGRYASLAIAVAAGLVVGLVASLAAMALASAFMAMGYDVDGVRALGEGIDPGTYTLSASMGLLFITVALAVTLPLAMRSGMTKAVRFIPMIIVLVVILVSAAIGSNDALFVAEFLDGIFADPNGPAMLAVVSLVGSIALYAVSAGIAARLYEAREM
ncbi:MAG: ABC-2 transporter permease [Coriobacteriaceae bacterium]